MIIENRCVRLALARVYSYSRLESDHMTDMISIVNVVASVASGPFANSVSYTFQLARWDLKLVMEFRKMYIGRLEHNRYARYYSRG